MRIVREASELRGAIESASSEALAAFGSGAVYVEKFLEKARHVEVQCLGDSHGNAIHLFDRDCSSQRRHQKLIEEAPAPAVDPVKRLETAEAAARLLREAGYCGAATVEFLMDANGDYSMLEVNTRVQVEHCVTEMVTGIDIVQASIRVAAGEPLGIDHLRSNSTATPSNVASMRKIPIGTSCLRRVKSRRSLRRGGLESVWIRMSARAIAFRRSTIP